MKIQNIMSTRKVTKINSETLDKENTGKRAKNYVSKKEKDEIAICLNCTKARCKGYCELVR